MKSYIAHDMAAVPELWEVPVSFVPGGETYECMGYSRTGNTVIFAKLVDVGNMRLRQINRYVDPDTPVYLEFPPRPPIWE